ncbi:MAG: MGMT family protein [Bdellovibrionales bacterium]|nr:MGMT family protein [Bdellovibrionales bacterium]
MDSFAEKCYAVLRQVPPGKVTTYQEIARALGSNAYRAVGQAMKRNPYAPEVPCHRVVQSDGSLGGFAWGPIKKRQLLEREGISVRHGRVQNFNQCLFKFGHKAFKEAASA